MRLNLSSPDVRESPLRGRSRRRELLHQNSISGSGDTASCSSSQSRLRHQTLAYGVERGDLDRAADLGTSEGLQIAKSEKVRT